MRRSAITLLLFCAWPLAAQITLTPATAFTNLVGGTPAPMIWLLGLGDGPFPVAVDIAGTGTTLAVGACTGSGCADVQTAICVVASDPCTPTVTSPATLYVFWSRTSYVLTAVGTYPASFPVTGSTTCNGAANCTVKASLQIVPAQRATVATKNGLTTGCSTSAPFGANLWPYFAANDLCPALPAVNAFTMPAPGNSYTDQFGGTVTIISGASGDPRLINSDATVASINADGTLVMNQTPGGTLKYTNTSTFADDYSTALAEGSWHPTIPNRKFEMVGLTITRRDFPAAPTTIFTYSGGGTTSITNGGINNIDSAGKTCFITKGGSDDKIALFDVASATAVYGTLNFPNANAGSCSTYGLDVVQNKHYIKVPKELAGHSGNLYQNDVFSWTPGAPTVVFEFTQPRTPNAAAYGYYYGGTVCSAASSTGQVCLNEQHVVPMNIGGQAYDLYPLQSNFPYAAYVVLMRMGSGQLMTTPVESGGGMYTVAVISTASLSDVHFGAAVTQPVAVISMDADPPQAEGISSALSGCTNAAPRVCAYTSAALSAALSDGTVIKLSGVRDSSGSCAATINTSWTIASLNTGAQTFALSTSTATGDCTPNTGAVVLNAEPDSASYQAGILFLDCRVLPCAITRLATSRSFSTFGSLFGDTSGSKYYGQSHAGIDPSGRWIGYTTNNREDVFRVAIIPTGFNPVSGGLLISGAARVSGAILGR